MPERWTCEADARTVRGSNSGPIPICDSSSDVCDLGGLVSMRRRTLRAHPSRLACFGWARPEVPEFGRRCGAPDRNQPIWLVHHGEGQIGPGDNATMRDLLSACSGYCDQDGVRGPPHGPWTPRGGALEAHGKESARQKERHAGSLRSAIYPETTTLRLASAVRVAHGFC